MTETSEPESEVNLIVDIGKKYVRALSLSLETIIRQLEQKPATKPVARPTTSLLRPKQPKQVVYVQKMTAKDERRIIGGILMITGVILIIAGLITSYNEWQTLPTDKLVLMTVFETMGWGIGATFAGFILLGIGLGVYLAKSHDQAWSRARKLLPIPK
jgi:hypothetical protein